MSGRQILAIGSQCAAIQPPLSFLPKLAEDLFRVMTDPAIGGCSPQSSQWLVDPTGDDAKEAIRRAFADASRNEATLVLAFIGHGQSIGNDFYIQLRDSPAEQVHDDNAIHLANLIKGEHRIHSNLDGLLVLIDACFSGMGAINAATTLVRDLEGKLRFVVLTAAENKPAYGGCFTKTIVDCLSQGMDSARGEFLRCDDLLEVIRQRCRRQEPQLLCWIVDKGLFLGRNQAWEPPLGGIISVSEEIERLTADFQPTPILSLIVERSGRDRGLTLVGLAGMGKSALAAALARPEVTEGIVPAGFVQAAAFYPAGLVAGDLARTLAIQLDRNRPAFAQAKERFLEANEDRRGELDALQCDVVGPLSRLRGAGIIRIVIDGLDQVPPDSAAMVQSALAALASMPHIRLIVTARPDTPQPTALTQLSIDILEDESLLSYLKRRGVPESLHQPILDQVRGNWLVAKLLADWVLAKGDTHVTRLPARLSEIYAQFLRRAGADTTARWRGELRPLLGVLAAAGVGPILPLKLLCAASRRLGRPDHLSRVRDRLVALRGLVIRARPGTDDEHVGLFHQTLVDYLLDPDNDTFGIDLQESHRALAEAIDQLAPPEFHDPDDPIYRYALAKEAEHLWAIGELGRWVSIPEMRDSVIPVENLRRWLSWAPRIQRALGPYNPVSLSARAKIAFWTGAVGEPREALRLCQELLPDQIRVLGPDHPNTLATRHNIAAWTGEVGWSREALRLFQELLPDRIRVLGPDHPDTLTTRHNIASWTGEVGEAREALRLLQELLPDRIRVLGPDHPDTLTTRHNIASWTGRVGEAREALRLLQELLPDRIRVLGPEHPDTHRTTEAIEWLKQQLQDRRDEQELLGESESAEQPPQDRNETPGSVSKLSWFSRLRGLLRRPFDR
jgi:hypothetical protein